MGAKEVLHRSFAGLVEEDQFEERDRQSGEVSEPLLEEVLQLAEELECYCSLEGAGAFPQLSPRYLGEGRCLLKAGEPQLSPASQVSEAWPGLRGHHMETCIPP